MKCSDGIIRPEQCCESDNHHRQLYEESRRAQEIYRSLLNSTPDAIVIYDLDGRAQYINDSFTHLFGWTIGDIKSGPMRFVPESELQATASIHDSVVSDGIPCSNFETKRYTKEGSVVDVGVTASRYNDHEGNPAGMLVILRDISSRKRAEELLLQSERLTAVGELASGVAHNFNNILQVTMGIAGLAVINLESGNLDKVRTYLNRILESSRLGAETVRRLQDFARIRTERTIDAQEVFDLSETVERALEIGQTWWDGNPEKALTTIVVSKDLDKECFVRGHENELFEVVINLVKNAAEALPGGGEIRISTNVEKGKVILRVKDNGVGIPKEHLAKVFEPFWTTKGHKGTGMGLASSLGIVTRYQGQIHLHSESGNGTAVTVKLPLGRSSGHAMEGYITCDLPPELRILAVDDTELVVTMLQEGLAEFGHEVHVAFSGPEALETFRRHPIDVVVCDLAMPGMSGWQVAKALEQICREKNKARAPFILLTGWGGQLGQERRIIEAGVDAVVGKPVDIEALMHVMEDVLQRSSER